MSWRQHLELPALLMAATIAVSGCAGKQIAFSDGTKIPLSELTREVTWMEDADLLMLQFYAKGKVIATTCDNLSAVELEGLNYMQEEVKAMHDVWLFPNITETAKQDWQKALNALIEHYRETADEEFCEDHAKELDKLGRSKVIRG
ncbi:hypothetical protein [Vibrio crassostreae]|uniref:hypothetical protein n=1 Tax=Vibrio crassostreae TaxID=246167 RepID=UPI001B3011EA|nr:hypothetical protein [Vibrio crassostreae]